MIIYCTPLQVEPVFNCQLPNKLEIILWNIYPLMNHKSVEIPWDSVVIDERSYYLELIADMSDNSIYELSLVIHNINGIAVSNLHMISN